MMYVSHSEVNLKEVATWQCGGSRSAESVSFPWIRTRIKIIRIHHTATWRILKAEVKRLLGWPSCIRAFDSKPPSRKLRRQKMPTKICVRSFLRINWEVFEKLALTFTVSADYTLYSTTDFVGKKNSLTQKR